MPALQLTPSGKDFLTINYPSISGQSILVENLVGLSAEIKGITINNSHFTVNTSPALNTRLGNINESLSTTSFTISSNWADAYYDGIALGTVSITVSGLNTTPSTSTVTWAVSGLFNGLEWPSNAIDNSGGWSYDSPQTHARLYVTSHI